MEVPQVDPLPTATDFVARLREIDDLQEQVAALARARSRVTSAEERFMFDLLSRLGPALMKLTKTGSEYVVIRPSKKGAITQVGKLGGNVVFRTAEGKMVPLVEHEDFKVLYNQPSSGLDSENFNEASDWLQSVMDEVDQMAA